MPREEVNIMVGAAFVWIAENAKARLRGEAVDESQKARDRDTTDWWQRAEGVDIEGEAERAREKLVDVGRAQE
jgi:hypothetical protein